MEGVPPIDVVEMKNYFANMAELCHDFFSELKGQGFSDDQAMRLTGAWLTQMVRTTKGEE